MELDNQQIAELKLIAPSLTVAEEGGTSFILISDYCLPDGCKPSMVDLLLCPTNRFGYESRLFFSERVEPTNKPREKPLNWNLTTRIVERNWHAFSWQTKPNLRLAQMLTTYIGAL